MGVNWEQVKIRLRANEEALERALQAGPERIQAVYRQRALQLASTQTSALPVSAGQRVIVFRLDRERYAIELTKLAEVLPFKQCTPVPGAPPRLLGVINLRGELHGVLDLSQLLAIPTNESADSGFILVLRHSDRRVGLRVDSIEDLNEIRPEELTVSTSGNYVKGLASGTLPLLDADKLLGDVFSKEEL